MERYFDAKLQRLVTRILPGEFAVVSGDEAIATTVGSCVSTCLWDPDLTLGGMNHFMLPHAQADGIMSISYLSYAGRYGINAMEMMINGLLQRGAARERLVAKVMGGANVIRDLESSDIGGENARFAVAYLETERIPILASDLGGVHPRAMQFFPANGELRMRYLRDEGDSANLLQRETGYAQALATPAFGSVDLFP